MNIPDTISNMDLRERERREYALRTLPEHRRLAGRWDDLYKLLTNFHFLEDKCRFLPVYDLELDYRSSLSTWQGESYQKDVLGKFEERLRLESNVIYKFPELLFPNLYNHLTWADSPDGPIHKLCENQRIGRQGWLRNVQTPQPIPNNLGYIPKGHTGGVTCIALTPDGKFLLSGSDDKTLILWDLHTRKAIKSFYGHTESIKAVVISPDGKIALSAGGLLKMWEIDSGQLLRNFEGYKGSINTVAISPDGKLAVSGSGTASTSGNMLDKLLELWDLQTGQRVHAFESISPSVSSVAFSPDGKTVLSGYYNLTMWDTKSGRKLLIMEGAGGFVPNNNFLPVGVVTKIDIAPDGKTALSGSTDKKVKYWDLQTGQLIHSFEGHTGNINAVAFTPDGSKAFSSSGDGVRQWDLNSGQQLQFIEPHKNIRTVWAGYQEIDTVNAISFVFIQDEITAIGSNLKFWDLIENKVKFNLIPSHNNQSVIAVAQDSKTAICNSRFDNSLNVWNLQSGDMRYCLEGHTDWINTLAMSQDGKIAASYSMDDTLKFWDLQKGQMLYSLQIKGLGGSKVIAISSAGVAATPARIGEWPHVDYILNIWEVKSGNLLCTLSGHKSIIKSIAISPDGKWAVSRSEDHCAKIWDLRTGALVRTLIVETNIHFHSCLVLSPAGKTFLAGTTTDHAIKLWNLHTGEILQTFSEDNNNLNSLAISPDSRFAAGSFRDGSIKLWGLVTGKMLYFIKNQVAYDSFLSFSSDGREIIAFNGSSVITLDSHSGRLIQSRTLIEGQLPERKSSSLHANKNSDVDGVAYGAIRTLFSPDGKSVYSYFNGGLRGTMRQDAVRRFQTIKQWDVENGSLLHSYEGHTNDVKAVVLSPDGRILISGSYDRTIKIWNTNSGQIIASIEAVEPVIHLVIAPDGKTFISQHEKPVLQHWESQTGKLLHTLEGHTQKITNVAIFPDSSRAVSCEKGGSLIYWDLLKGELLRSIGGNQEEILKLYITKDGNTIITIENRTFRFWDAKTGQLRQTIGNFFKIGIQKTVFTYLDGHFAFEELNDSHLDSHTIRIWELRTGKLLRSFVKNHKWKNTRAITPDGQMAISGSDDETLRLWDMQTGDPLRIFEGTVDLETPVVISQDQKKVMSGMKDNAIGVWELESGKLICSLTGYRKKVSTMIFSPTAGKAITAYAMDKSFRYWDLLSGRVLRSFESNASFSALTFLKDEKTAISGSEDGIIRYWDLDTGQQIWAIDAHKGPVTSLSSYRGGQMFISSSGDKTVKLWDAPSGQCIRSFVHEEPIVLASILKDQRTLLSQSKQYGHLHYWDLYNGQLIHENVTLARHYTSLRQNIVENRNLIQHGNSFLDIKCGRKTSILKTQTGDDFTICRFSQDGRYMVTCIKKGIIKVWDITTTNESQTLHVNDAEINSLALSSDDRWVTCSDIAGRVWIFEWMK